MTSKLETGELSKVSFYYNFASYSLLAGSIFVICMILASFKSEKISKRTIVSSMNYKKYNRKLLIANGIFAVLLWALYVIISIIMFKDTILSIRGLIYLLNSLIFTFCALSIAFLIGNLVKNKEAISGIVNVIALGSSFLCGAFVPMEWLPDTVLKIAHVFPTYWYIKTNEALKTVEEINFNSVKPLFANMTVMVGFIIFFVVIINIASTRKKTIV